MAKAKRRKNVKQKGSAFEREICHAFSNWWTKGKRDDIFWRSQTSGGRATNRSKEGKRTEGQYGDMCAADPDGSPLIDVFTIEIKRGYNNATPIDLIDRPTVPKSCVLTNWIAKIQECVEYESGSLSWMIVHKRDQRVPMIYMETPIHLELVRLGCLLMDPHCFISKDGIARFYCTSLENFFASVKPKHIKELSCT